MEEKLDRSIYRDQQEYFEISKFFEFQKNIAKYGPDSREMSGRKNSNLARLLWMNFIVRNEPV